MRPVLEPRVWRTSPLPSEDAVVIVSARLLLELAEDANPGCTFTVEWGRPRGVETYPGTVSNVYDPVITKHVPQWRAVAEAAPDRAPGVTL